MMVGIEWLVLLLALATAVYLGITTLRGGSGGADAGYLAQVGRQPERPVASRPRLGPIGRRLVRAGVGGPPEAHFFVVASFAVLVGLQVLDWLPEVPLASVIATVLVGYLPWAALGEAGRLRANRLEEHLANALRVAAGTAEAGASLTQALSSAAVVSPPLLRRELEQVLSRLTLGASPSDAMAPLQERFDSEGVRLVTLALAAKARVGGPLAPLLTAIADTLGDRLRHQRQVRAQLSGARYSAVAMMLLPYAAAPIVVWLQPGWFDALRTSTLGNLALFVAILAQAVGMLWIWRILSREL